MIREFLALPSTVSGSLESVIHVPSCAAQLYIPSMAAYCSTKSAANQIITKFGFDELEGNVKFLFLPPCKHRDAASYRVCARGWRDLGRW